MDYYLSVKDLETEIECLKRNFDEVRLVNPIEHKAYKIENGVIKSTSNDCHSVWKKVSRCENCISTQAYIKKETLGKFEFIDKDIYYMQVRYIEVQLKKFVLEIIQKIPNNIRLEANQTSEFIEKITAYNNELFKDSLTEVYNRRYFENNIINDMTITKKKKSSFFLVIMELGNLKTINDIFGYVIGDNFLRKIIFIINSHISSDEDNYIVRYNGHSFLLALHNHDYKYYDTLLKEVRKSILEEGKKFHDLVEIKYGIGELDSEIDDQTAEKLIYLANEDMYDRQRNYN